MAEPITGASPQLAIVCDGGTVSNGACICPTGFDLMPVSDHAGGTCVRSNAENCLGGEPTVSGNCMCNGQVTMDGETYLLEYSNGKCLPMRCPVTARLQEGHCVASPSPQLSSEPEPKPRAAKDTRDADVFEPRHRCEHGMIHTRSRCGPGHRRLPEISEPPAPILPELSISRARVELKNLTRDCDTDLVGTRSTRNASRGGFGFTRFSGRISLTRRLIFAGL